MIRFTLLHPKMTQEHLGFIPEMLDERDPRPAQQQLDAGYQHGGGFDPFVGFTLHADNSLTYRNDPPLRPLALTLLRDELIVYYRHSWVAIIQPDRRFVAARMD
jgi:hypothetical protein